jgi:ribonuclease HI
MPDAPPLIIFTDGGSRHNPGPSAAAFVAMQGEETIHEHSVFLGTKTNNEAEYLALLASINWLATLAPPPVSVEFRLDSLLVVQQMLGAWRIKDQRMQVLHDQCQERLCQVLPQSTYQFVHIPRAQNARADALVNLVLDQRS